MEKKIAKIESDLARLQKELRSALCDQVVAKLNKLQMLKGSSDIYLGKYENEDGSTIRNIYLDDSNKLCAKVYVKDGQSGWSGSVKDYKFFISKIDEELKIWLPLEPYMVVGEYSAEVEYISNDRSGKKTLIKADTLHKLFIQFYNMNRSLRYCNGCCHRFVDSTMEKSYWAWNNSLPRSLSMDLYYGNGVVD